MGVSNFPDGLNVGSAAGGTAEFQIGGTAVTLTAADLNALDAASLSATELAYVDGVSPGTVTASKAVVVSASKGIDVLTVTLGTVTTLATTTATVGTSTTTLGTVTTLVAPAATFSGTANVSGVLQLGGTAITATPPQLNAILPYSAADKKMVSGTQVVPAGGSGTAFVPSGLTAAECIVTSLYGPITPSNFAFADTSITTGTVTALGYCLAGTAALTTGTVTYIAIGT